MAPPAKRRKRNVVNDSDEEDRGRKQANTLSNFLFSSPDQHSPLKANASTAASPSPSPAARKSSRPSASNSKATKPLPRPIARRNNGATINGGKSASTSPEKPRRGPNRSKAEIKANTADLKTLFSKQAERAPKASSTKLDDILSDPISDEDEDEAGGARQATASHIGNNARKRFNGGLQNGPGLTSTSSQRFMRPSSQLRQPDADDEQRPWCERFGPVNLDELAVHKKKVADVRRWLEDVIAGRLRQRLLILKGAAGTGKTTTVRLLAKEMHCEILEWKNPTQSFVSASAQFEEFMGRGGKFGQLETDTESALPLDTIHGKHNDGTRRIIFIEEFPNTFMKSSSALQSFRNTIMQYLASNTPSLATFGQQVSKEPVTPVIMVISETLLTTTSASADSFTVHRLLGPEITRHPGACIIEFNSIAPTLLGGALELIVRKEARKSGRRRTPGPMVLKRLGDIGDIRSAISSLEFLCLKGDTDIDWGSKVTFAKAKRGSQRDTPLTQGEQESLELISQREASLGIFHAVGKVVYNKRDDVPMAESTPEGAAEIMPDYMKDAARPKRSQVSVDTLIDETGTDTHTFISALHENYILSCEPTGPADPYSAIDYINGCIEYLSESDLLCPGSDVFFGGRGSGGFSGRDSASHILRQDEFSFQLATRGLLFSLPRPVKRTGSSKGRGGGDAFKMFYPSSLKLWREKEELGSILDHWSTKILIGADVSVHDITEGASAFRKPRTTNSGEWLSRKASNASNGQQKSPEHDDNNTAPLLSLGSSARRELLLERLPYMAHIARRRKTSFSSLGLREIDSVVSFSGINGVGDEDYVDGEDTNGVIGDEWATDKPTEERSPRKRGVKIRHRSDGAVLELPVQTLVLSDDDIEDD
jgi:cell cycle checkpoint protein